MLASYPSAWLLLTLPFLSTYVIRGVPSLLALAGRRNATMRLTGVAGLAAMLVALIGVVPPVFGLPVMLVGGAVAGFTVFTLPLNGESDGDDWRWWHPPPDDPPPPGTDGPLDWDQFDRIRAHWERQPVLRR
jgi:hypothetical protein